MTRRHPATPAKTSPAKALERKGRISSQSTLCYSLASSLKGVNEFMAIDPDLLEILVCPKTKGELELVELPEEVRRQLVDKYREHFRDDEPVVEQALFSPDSNLVYPIVSDIPIMLVDEALPASSIGR